MKEITTYLNFNGNCREAMTFYAKCLGAELQLMPFSEVPGDFPKEAKDLIMHARISKGRTLLMASDCPPGKPLQRATTLRSRSTARARPRSRPCLPHSVKAARS